MAKIIQWGKVSEALVFNTSEDYLNYVRNVVGISEELLDDSVLLASYDMKEAGITSDGALQYTAVATALRLKFSDVDSIEGLVAAADAINFDEDGVMDYEQKKAILGIGVLLAGGNYETAVESLFDTQIEYDAKKMREINALDYPQTGVVH